MKTRQIATLSSAAIRVLEVLDRYGQVLESSDPHVKERGSLHVEPISVGTSESELFAKLRRSGMSRKRMAEALDELELRDCVSLGRAEGDVPVVWSTDKGAVAMAAIRK